MTELVISFTVDGLHFWPNAPEKYKEFGQPHRHLFKFICWYPVDIKSANDRPIELWELRQFIRTIVVNSWSVINESYECDFGEMSCEGIAQWLMVIQPSISKVFCGEEYWLGAIVYELDNR